MRLRLAVLLATLPAALTFATETPPDIAAAVASADPVAGEAAAGECIGCHSVRPFGPEFIGPNLYGVFGRRVGDRPGFDYSDGMVALNEAGATWTAERLNAFLVSPNGAIPGTTMFFGGLVAATDRVNVIAFLRTLTETPLPPDGVDPGLAAQGAD